MDWKHLLAYITGTIDQELLLRNEYLVTENRVAYLLAADKYSRPLASRLIGVNQSVIRTRNGFSTLHPTQLVCI